MTAAKRYIDAHSTDRRLQAILRAGFEDLAIERVRRREGAAAVCTYLSLTVVPDGHC